MSSGAQDISRRYSGEGGEELQGTVAWVVQAVEMVAMCTAKEEPRGRWAAFHLDFFGILEIIKSSMPRRRPSIQMYL